MRSSIPRRALACIALVCAFAAAAATAWSQPVVLDRVLVSSAAVSSSGSVTLRGSAGQPAIGRVDGSAMDAWIGFWYLPSQMPVGVGDSPLAAALLEADLYPNPAPADVRIRVRLPQPGSLRVRAVDASGRIVLYRACGYLPQGAFAFALTATELRAGESAVGVRFVILESTTNSGTLTRVLPLVLLH